MDGVLIDSEHHWQRTEQALFRQFGIELSESMLYETRGLNTVEMEAHWRKRYPDELEQIGADELMARYDGLMVDTMNEEVELMDGAREALDFFRERGLPLALATCSSYEHIRAVLDKHQLGELFPVRVSASGDIPGKPHPEVFLECARQLQADPTSCLVIEDSFHGLVAGKAARMKVLSFPDPGEYHQERFGAADLKIRSLHEIGDELLQKLENT